MRIHNLVIILMVVCLWTGTVSTIRIAKYYDRQLDLLGEAYGIGIQNCNEKLKEVNQKYLQCNGFRQILMSAKSEVYNRATNNCYMQSKRMQAELLSKYGIVSSIFINENRNHAWLGVWVEATSGQFVPASNNLHMIEVRDHNQDVVLSNPRLVNVPVSTEPFPVLWRN